MLEGDTGQVTIVAFLVLYSFLAAAKNTFSVIAAMEL